jgi:catechol 2,3-dioxygenase-like lactoylglutathione lyase family enzyme
VLGRFHEIGISTRDIRDSVKFYEGLGFTHATTTDTWSHPYGVLTDGRLFIGLHQLQASKASLSLTFVLPGVAARLAGFERLGLDLTTCRTGDEVFNEIGFLDPFGQPVTVLEARTYSPVERAPEQVSLCGYFEEISLPAGDFEMAKRFWEPLGFVATEESEAPYVHLALTSDHLDLAFHRPRLFDLPMLVFRDPDMPGRIARLREQGVRCSNQLPRGLDPGANALLQSPEGTHLLLLHEEG